MSKEQTPANTNAKNMKKVDKFADLLKFEKAGDAVQGVLLRIRHGQTVHGEASFAEISDENGERKSFIISSGLEIFCLEDYIGQKIKVVYTGDVVNEKTKRTFKDFDLFVEE